MTKKIEEQPMPDAGDVRFLCVAQYGGFRRMDDGTFELTLLTDTGLRVELSIDRLTFFQMSRDLEPLIRAGESEG